MFKFTPATPADHETLLDLIQSYYAYDHIPYDRAAMAPGLMQWIQDSSIGRAWLIREDDRILGYFLYSYGFDLEFGGRTALITDLFIQPEHRRRGLGQAALEFISKTCASEGVHSLELQVESDNTEAQGLYAKFGFRRLTRVPMSKRID